LEPHRDLAFPGLLASLPASLEGFVLLRIEDLQPDRLAVRDVAHPLELRHRSSRGLLGELEPGTDVELLEALRFAGVGGALFGGFAGRALRKEREYAVEQSHRRDSFGKRGKRETPRSF